MSVFLRWLGFGNFSCFVCIYYIVVLYLYNRDARPGGVSGFFRVRPVFFHVVGPLFFQVSTVFCLLSSPVRE